MIHSDICSIFQTCPQFQGKSLRRWEETLDKQVLNECGIKTTRRKYGLELTLDQLSKMNQDAMHCAGTMLHASKLSTVDDFELLPQSTGPQKNHHVKSTSLMPLQALLPSSEFTVFIHPQRCGFMETVLCQDDCGTTLMKRSTCFKGSRQMAHPVTGVVLPSFRRILSKTDTS